MSQPLVTIIMPVFNAASYVTEAIESVLAQTYENWELIIVNDGSTDESEALIKRISDKRIRYFYQNNAGVSNARNTALAHMRGYFLLFLDSDDALPPDSISLRWQTFQQHLEVDFVDGKVDVYDSSMKTWVRTWTPGVRGHVTRPLVRLDGNCFFGITWMIRVKPGILYAFDEQMTHGEDLLFFVGISKVGKYDFVGKAIYKRRLVKKSAMTDLDALGRGYRLYYSKVVSLARDSITYSDRIILFFRIRKIMFLTYLKIKQFGIAFRYLIAGR